MASELHVDAIKHSGGTSALTIDSSGNVHKAGFVVQTSFHTFTTETSIASNSDVDVGGSSHTFTPKFASSLLILSYSVQINLYRQSTNQQGGMVNFVVDGVNITHASEDYEVYHASPSSMTVNEYDRLHKEVSMSASNTNAKTVKLTARPFATGGSGALLINPSANFTSSVKIQEIAQ